MIELKEDIKPQVFSLEPVGPYQHRLVLDLYPVNPPDPLMALLREQATPRDSDFAAGAAAVPASDRAGDQQADARAVAPDASAQRRRRAAHHHGRARSGPRRRRSGRRRRSAARYEKDVTLRSRAGCAS